MTADTWPSCSCCGCWPRFREEADKWVDGVCHDCRRLTERLTPKTEEPERPR